MSNLDLVMTYMDIFYSAEDPRRLADILATDLVFEGPFFHGRSAQEYMDRLSADPPVGCRYELLHSFESGNAVNLIYRFIKDDIRCTMSQLFEIRDERIARITLIFDSRRFS